MQTYAVAKFIANDNFVTSNRSSCQYRRPDKDERLGLYEAVDTTTLDGKPISNPVSKFGKRYVEFNASILKFVIDNLEIFQNSRTITYTCACFKTVSAHCRSHEASDALQQSTHSPEIKTFALPVDELSAFSLTVVLNSATSEDAICKNPITLTDLLGIWPKSTLKPVDSLLIEDASTGLFKLGPS